MVLKARPTHQTSSPCSLSCPGTLSRPGWPPYQRSTCFSLRELELKVWSKAFATTSGFSRLPFGFWLPRLELGLGGKPTPRLILEEKGSSFEFPSFWPDLSQRDQEGSECGWVRYTLGRQLLGLVRQMGRATDQALGIRKPSHCCLAPEEASLAQLLCSNFRSKLKVKGHTSESNRNLVQICHEMN